jgi:hypothetical protein
MGFGHGLYPVACDHRHFECDLEFLRPARKPGGPFKVGDRADGLLAERRPLGRGEQAERQKYLECRHRHPCAASAFRIRRHSLTKFSSCAPARLKDDSVTNASRVN